MHLFIEKKWEYSNQYELELNQNLKFHVSCTQGDPRKVIKQLTDFSIYICFSLVITTAFYFQIFLRILLSLQCFKIYSQQSDIIFLCLKSNIKQDSRFGVLKLGDVIVLVLIIFVSFHVISIDQRFYAFFQVSGLKFHLIDWPMLQRFALKRANMSSMHRCTK